VLRQLLRVVSSCARSPGIALLRSLRCDGSVALLPLLEPVQTTTIVENRTPPGGQCQGGFRSRFVRALTGDSCRVTAGPAGSALRSRGSEETLMPRGWGRLKRGPSETREGKACVSTFAFIGPSSRGRQPTEGGAPLLSPSACRCRSGAPPQALSAAEVQGPPGPALSFLQGSCHVPARLGLPPGSHQAPAMFLSRKCQVPRMFLQGFPSYNAPT
jgi:hypothetical protein